MRNKPPILLLLIEGTGRNHYTYIRNLNRLLSSAKQDPKVFCPYYCYGFCTRYDGKRNLANHIKMCEEYGAQRIELLPEEEKYI